MKRFLSLLFFLLLARSAAGDEALRGDGVLRLYNYHLNEFAEVKFRDGGAPVPDGVAAIQKLLRSRGNQQILPIAIELLDLVDHLQDHFQADTVEVISGYRDKEFNAQLLKDGHKVSPVSLHTKGQAMDIHVDEVTEETLRDYAISLKRGGVGYYGPLDFVHVDLGTVKTWEEPKGARKLVGVLKPDAPVRLTSDKNDYLPGESLLFTWTLPPDADLNAVTDLKLEWFHRGQWTACETPADPKKKEGLPSSALLCRSGDPKPEFGKYRWLFRWNNGPDVLSSNEFYLKKM